MVGLVALILTFGCVATRTRGPSLPQVWDGTPVPEPAEAISLENVKEMQEVARWGKGTISEVAWSPDGELLAVGSYIGVFIYDTESFEQVNYL
jgi:hypothetical protein